MALTYISHTHTALTDLKGTCISQFNLFLRNLHFFLFGLQYPLRGWSQ